MASGFWDPLPLRNCLDPPKGGSLPLPPQLKAGNPFAFLLPAALAQMLSCSLCVSSPPLLLPAAFVWLGDGAVTLPGGLERGVRGVGSAARADEASRSEQEWCVQAALCPCCCE